MATFKIDKDPDAVLAYKFDWKASTNGSGASDWLGTGQTISAIVVTPESGITVDSSTITDTSTTVTVVLSGGTAGEAYDVACHITTNDSYEDERTLRVMVRDR